MAGSAKGTSFKSIFEVRKLLRGEGSFNQWPKSLEKNGVLNRSRTYEFLVTVLQTLYTADLQETMPAVGTKALNPQTSQDWDGYRPLIRNDINVTVNINPDK